MVYLYECGAAIGEQTIIVEIYFRFPTAAGVIFEVAVKALNNVTARVCRILQVGAFKIIEVCL